MFYIHELTHVEINNKFGVESHISFCGLNPCTIRDTNFFSDSDKQTAILAHCVNEIVGYTFLPLLIVIITILFAKNLFNA